MTDHTTDATHARHPLAHRSRTLAAALSHLWSSRVNVAAIDLLAPEQGECILELGPGFGPATADLARRVSPTGRVIAVDPSRVMRLVLRARRRAMANRRTIEVRAGAGEAIPVPDRSVDRLLALNVMHHLDDLDQTTSELARVLKPGGRLVLIDEDFAHPEHSFAQVADGNHHGPDLVDPEHLAQLLTTAGFIDVEPRSGSVAGEPTLTIVRTKP